MLNNTPIRTALAALTLATPAALAQNDNPGIDEQRLGPDQPWVTVDETDDRVLRLRIAIKEFERQGDNASPDDPELVIAGAVHVGDRSYYRALQQLLDAKDLVLYEGVNPSGTREDIPTSPSGRRQLTEDRIRLVATLFAQTATPDDQEQTDTPNPLGDTDTIPELRAALADNTRATRWLDRAAIDAWGNPLVIEPATTSLAWPGPDATAHFDIVSFGRDNAPGGTGEDRDARMSAQQPLTPVELGQVPGIQQQLADALRLRFQLEEMDETGERWRNADMTIAEVRERVIELGGDPEPLLGSLRGSGLSSRIVGFFLNIIEILPGAQPRAKMMMIEMLGEAEGILEAGGAGPLGPELLEVIIDQRNQRVIDMLAAVVNPDDDGQPSEAARNTWDQLGIIYGAGHMTDLEQRLKDQLGYVPVSTRYVTAMRLDLDRWGISPMERAMYRNQIRRQLDMMRGN